MTSIADRKGRGAFYTPPEMIQPMIRWAIREGSEHVLDGGAGESAFLVAAAERLADLGTSPRQVGRQIHGIELDPSAADLARKAVASTLGIEPSEVLVKCGSFFDETPGGLTQVKACVGNPPYIRYQSFSGDVRKQALMRAAEGGVKLTGLTSSWAPFLVHACRFILPGGRLAQVLPAELLQTGYAQPVRDFLVQRFRSVVLVVFDARVFPGALEEVVLVLADDEGRPGLQVREAENLEDLSRIVDGSGSRTRSISRPKEKWTRYLLQHDQLRAYDECARSPQFARLSEYARTDIGVVTGANSFFVLDERNAEAAGISQRDLIPTISKAEHVQGLHFRKKDLDGLKEAGEPFLLFYPADHSLDQAAGRYVRSGKWIGLDKRYKCRTRDPWWKVPGVKIPDAFITYMANEAPRVALNEAGALSTNTVHRIYLYPEAKDLRRILPVLYLNSLTLLSTELEGRSYGGGVLKLEPRECGRLLLPRIEFLDVGIRRELRSLMGRVDRLVRARRMAEAVAEVDQIVLQEAVGLSSATIEAIQQARQRLYARRMNRMGSRLR